VLVAVVTPDGALQRRVYRPDAEYIYPASCVKSAAAIAALRELRRHQAQWSLPLHLSCPLVFHPQGASRVRGRVCGVGVDRDRQGPAGCGTSPLVCRVALPVCAPNIVPCPLR